MTMHVNAGPSRARVLQNARATRALWWIAAALLFAVAVCLRQIVAANTDVSWLLIAADKLIAGKRLYLDIIETNPPMAVLTYVPAVLIARVLGVPAEAVVDGLVFAAIAISLGLTACILRASTALGDRQRWPVLLLGIAVLAILPAQSFAQREHIAIVELLPALALLALRANGDTPRPWAVLIGGIGLGLALSFKPYFALALLCAVAAAALYVKSWRVVLAPENFVAAGFVAVYAAATALVFPDYFTVIGPMVRDVYMPIGPSWTDVLLKPVMLLWGVALAAALLIYRRGATQLLLVAISIGFAIVFVLQRKGWPYHSYPMMVFALLALGHAITAEGSRVRTSRGTLAGALALLAGLFLQSMVWFDRAFDARALQPHVARLGPHPVVLAITGEPGLGHPLTRALGGTWVSRQQAIWVAHYESYLRKTGAPDAQKLAMLERYAARERQWLAQDIRETPPDVVLVDNLTGDWSGWLTQHPDIADLLQNYHRVDSVMGVDILTRSGDR